VWGKDLVKGVCSSLNIAYKLFNPNGTPIRAMCKVTIREMKDDERRVAEERRSSPDLTHYRTVKKGDTLPLMCYRIYGHSKYYVQVAKVNGLSNFRNLQPGTELFFPPIDKTVQ
jgi:nucleoid-associated protein YgaU